MEGKPQACHGAAGRGSFDQGRLAPDPRARHDRRVAPPTLGLDLDTPPFDLLDDAERERVRAAADIVFFGAGERVIEAGAAAPGVYVILKGKVLALDARDGREQRFAEYGPGELFGAFAVIAGRARHRYSALEELLCHVIPAPVFAGLVERNPRFAAYFLESLAVKRRLLAERDQPSDLAELLLARTGDALVLDAVELAHDAPIADAVAAMHEHGSDCVLVRRDDTLGIATRTDLLDALALRGADTRSAVGAHASYPALTVDVDAFLFQALVLMTQRHIHRVVVTRGGAVSGTLGLMELLAHFAGRSHAISFRLARARTPEALAAIATELTPLVRTLHAQGAKTSFLMELMSALNRRLLARAFELAIPEALCGAVCLLALGSEGRREQILKTDQDNALILADDLDWPDAAERAAHFSAQLEALGFPPCSGGVMACNPAWRRTQRAWLAQLDAWIAAPTPAAVMSLAIFADAASVAGDAALLEPLRARLFALAADGVALRAFAQVAVDFQAPLTLFGGLKGDARRFDLKRGGIFPIVHGLRALALELRLAPTNSFERAEAAIASGALHERFGRDLTQALSVLIRLRLGEQLRVLKDGGAADDRIDATALRRLDRDLLRDALRVVGEFQGWLRARYRLE